MKKYIVTISSGNSKVELSVMASNEESARQTAMRQGCRENAIINIMEDPCDTGFRQGPYGFPHGYFNELYNIDERLKEVNISKSFEKLKTVL